MSKKKIIYIIIVIILTYIWVELAVGIFFQNSWGGS